MSLIPYTPEYWLAHAEEARAIAGVMKKPHTKWSMLCVAKGYEKLAEHAQEHADLIAQAKIAKQEPE